MAIPSGVLTPPNQQVPIEYGAYVSVAPRSEFYGTEIELSTASSAASTAWRNYERRDASAGQQVWYRVVTPNDGKTRYVRARHWSPGFLAGAWFPSTSSTATVSFTPTKLPETLPPGAQVLFDGGGIRSTDIKPGVPGQSTTLTKTHRFGAQAFTPGSTANASFDKSVAFLRPATTGAAISMFTAVPFVRNSVITRIRMQAFKGTTSDSVGVLFRESDTTGLVATLKTLTSTSTGWNIVQSSAMSVAVSSAVVHFFNAQLTANSTDINNASLLYVEYDYTVTDYAFSL